MAKIRRPDWLALPHRCRYCRRWRRADKVALVPVLDQHVCRVREGCIEAEAKMLRGW
jgi:hypothetical protein